MHHGVEDEQVLLEPAVAWGSDIKVGRYQGLTARAGMQSPPRPSEEGGGCVY
jgi:hypothetical protein